MALWESTFCVYSCRILVVPSRRDCYLRGLRCGLWPNRQGRQTETDWLLLSRADAIITSMLSVTLEASGISFCERPGGFVGNWGTARRLRRSGAEKMEWQRNIVKIQILAAVQLTDDNVPAWMKSTVFQPAELCTELGSALANLKSMS